MEEVARAVFFEEPDTETYNLVRQRQNNDIQHKSDLKLLPFRMQRFLNTFNAHGRGPAGQLAIPLSALDEEDEVLVLVVDDAPTVVRGLKAQREVTVLLPVERNLQKGVRVRCVERVGCVPG